MLIQATYRLSPPLYLKTVRYFALPTKRFSTLESHIIVRKNPVFCRSRGNADGERYQCRVYG